MQNFSPAFDEITHLPSGFSYLKTGEVKLNPQHPPLIKMLSAFPLLFLDLKFDAQDPHLAGPKTDEWQFGRDFLFNNGVDRLIFWGRIPIILLSVLLGWYIFKWGKELFGYKAGVMGLFIYAFMPNIIAHSQLVTMDLGVTVFSFIALYHLWKFTVNPCNKNILYSGLSLGLALGSKFSAVFLLPISLFLLTVYIQKKYPSSSWSEKISALLKIIVPIWGLAFLVIWGLYLFPKDILFYWKGLSTVYADRNPNHFYYLNGSFNHTGWWYYFLWAFIIKTPVAFLAVLGLALAYYKRQKLSFLNSAFIFLPVILFLLITSWKALNIGVRYVLPIYPFLILFVSGYLSKITENWKLPACRRGRKIENSSIKILILILAVWYVFSAINVYPDYLSYFNEIVGGSKNGYKHLDDSNIEWGQDLKRLAAYQKENPGLKVFLWTDSDAYRSYGIKNILPLNFKDDWLNPSGKYAVSTHVLIRTRLASQVYNNDLLDWMDNYKSVDRIGQSFF
ncbi:MAG: glycosyltransferase family 39 protein, partial [Patescibacteria group bacterium]